MATTSLWHIKGRLSDLIAYVENPEKTVPSGTEDFFNVFSYIQNQKKTADGSFVTAINCLKQTALRQMILTKQRYGKEDKYIAWHGYQSFKPGEVTPERCHEIGVKLAKEMWGGQFQVIVTTHLDKGHLHNHFCFNSVSFRDGRKYNYSKAEQRRLRDISDRLCREYGLSVIEHGRKAPSRPVWLDERNGKPTRYNLMREAMEAALKVSVDGNDLRKALREQGYELDADPAHKYATLRRIGSKQAVRLYRLGEAYDLPAIRERIEENRQRYARDYSYHRYRPVPVQRIRPRRLRLDGSLSGVRQIDGFRGLYFHYCYCLGLLPKNSLRRPLSPELREECRRLDAISRQAQLICREKLDTAEEVTSFISGKQSEMRELGAARQHCYNRLRRCDDEEEIAKIKGQRDRLTVAMAACRKDIRTAEAVLSRSACMKENLKAERAMQAQRMVRVQDKHRERGCAR